MILKETSNKIGSKTNESTPYLSLTLSIFQLEYNIGESIQNLAPQNRDMMFSPILKARKISMEEPKAQMQVNTLHLQIDRVDSCHSIFPS